MARSIPCSVLAQYNWTERARYGSERTWSFPEIHGPSIAEHCKATAMLAGSLGIDKMSPIDKACIGILAVW